jgi:DNA-binding CsgD family transcriptional regulator
MKATAWRARRTAALYREGHPYNEIARRVGVSTATVFRDLKRSGIELRPRPQMQPQGLTDRNREVASAYAEAGSLRAVGEQYGMTPRAVWHHVQRNKQWPS